MKITRDFRSILAVVSMAALLACLCTPALAGDYDDVDFSLRFPAGLTRFATYGDVAGVGNASAGSQWSSSVNPASQSWFPIDGKYKVCASPQYSRVWFENGTEIGVAAESVTIDLGEWGTLMGAGGQVNSNKETMRNGYEFDLTADLQQVQWGKKITDDWAVGALFGHTESCIRNDLGDMKIASSNSDSYTIRGGSLHSLTEKLMGGLVLDYGWSRDRTQYHAIDAFGIPETHERDTTRQFLARPGVAFEYKKKSYIYFDYQSGTFWNDTGTLNTHRAFVGIEHGITDWLYARGGSVIDMCVGETAWTGGIGLYPTKWLSVDLAYQYNMFPEISEEFGRSQTLNVSMSITF